MIIIRITGGGGGGGSITITRLRVLRRSRVVVVVVIDYRKADPIGRRLLSAKKTAQRQLSLLRQKLCLAGEDV